MRNELARGHLDLLILSALADGSLHGYAIIDAIRERSDNSVNLPEGSVYPALHRLQREGLLRSTWSKGDGRPRRTYSLSRRGQADLERQRDEWRSFSRTVNKLVGLTT